MPGAARPSHRSVKPGDEPSRRQIPWFPGPVGCGIRGETDGAFRDFFAALNSKYHLIYNPLVVSSSLLDGAPEREVPRTGSGRFPIRTEADLRTR